MGRGADYSEALLKAFITSHVKLPQSGEVFLSLREKDKEIMLPLVKELLEWVTQSQPHEELRIS